MAKKTTLFRILGTTILLFAVFFVYQVAYAWTPTP